MLSVNFFLPKTQYTQTFLFATNYTFSDMINLLKNTMDNNRDIILTLNGKTLKYDGNTLLTNCNIRNNDNIYIRLFCKIRQKYKIVKKILNILK